MWNRGVPALSRVLLGLVALTAIAVQFSIQIRDGFGVVNFFSYFTNLANLFAAIVFVVSARGVFPDPQGRSLKDQAWLDQVRAVSAVNMTLVGVVFAVLLRNVDLGSLLPWVNVVLHYIMPCAVVLDWLLRPPAMKLGIRHGLLCLVFPAFYLVYVLVRGHVAGWYPYPFLNPANPGGYGSVAVHIAGIAIAFLVASWSLLALGNTLGQHAVAPE